MSMLITGRNGNTYGATGVQKTVNVNGSTTYSGARGMETPEGAGKGTKWAVVVDANGEVVGGGRSKGAIDADGNYIVRNAVVTPDAARFSGQIAGEEIQAVWNNYV